jgi:Fe-S cluster biogenesis protein NfuA
MTLEGTVNCYIDEEEVDCTTWEKKVELNDLNVNNVLDEIRPYIEADGGYLEYVAIDYLKDGPIVMIRLLGACAGCSMSADTLKLGIERLVKEKFPEVQQVISV